MQIAGGWIPLAPAGGLRERMMNIHTREDCLLSHDSSTHACWSNTCRVFISLLYSQLLRSLRLKFSMYSMCLNYRDLQLACLLACLLTSLCEVGRPNWVTILNHGIVPSALDHHSHPSSRIKWRQVSNYYSTRLISIVIRLPAERLRTIFWFPTKKNSYFSFFRIVHSSWASLPAVCPLSTKGFFSRATPLLWAGIAQSV